MKKIISALTATLSAALCILPMTVGTASAYSYEKSEKPYTYRAYYDTAASNTYVTDFSAKIRVPDGACKSALIGECGGSVTLRKENDVVYEVHYKNANGATKYENLASVTFLSPWERNFFVVEDPYSVTTKYGYKAPVDVSVVLVGDANNDGEVNMADSVFINQYIRKYIASHNNIVPYYISIWENPTLSAADVNNDGKLDFDDANLISMYCADLIPDFSDCTNWSVKVK